jgi:hypothetical protein
VFYYFLLYSQEIIFNQHFKSLTTLLIMLIPVGLQNANLGTEITRDLNYLDSENPKEYSLYFEDFPSPNNLKVDVKSDASIRILKSDRYEIHLKGNVT